MPGKEPSNQKVVKSKRLIEKTVEQTKQLARAEISEKIASLDREVAESIVVHIDKHRYITDKAPRTTEELYKAVEVETGMSLPWSAAWPGNNSILEYVDSVYFRVDPFSLIMGPRGGGKTMNMGIAEWISMRYRSTPDAPVEITHASADKAQAFRVQKYIKDFLARNKVRYQTKLVSVERLQVTKSSITLDNGAVWYIITGSATGVNSHHPEIASFDEIEWWPYSDLGQTWACPVSRFDRGKVWTAGSTRQRVGSAMFELVKDVEDGVRKEIRLFKTNAFDIMQRCPTCLALDAHPYGTSEQREEVCSLWQYCHGKVGTKSSGFYPREDLASWATADPKGFRTQGLCSEPDTGGTIFDEIFIPHPVDSDKRGHKVRWQYKPAMPYYIWWDPAEGLTSVGYFVQIYNKRTIIIFDMLVHDACLTPTDYKKKLDEHIRMRGYLPPECIVVDPHRSDAAADMRRGSKYGEGENRSFNTVLPKMPRTSGGGNKGLGGGEEIIPSLQKVIKFFVERRILVDARFCSELIDRGINIYAYPTDSKGVRTSNVPSKKGSDFIDPIRYGLVWYIATFGEEGS